MPVSAYKIALQFTFASHMLHTATLIYTVFQKNRTPKSCELLRWRHYDVIHKH